MASTPPPDSGFWPRLLHRWFVEFNPLYLVSAAFTLVGVSLSSRALAPSSSGALAVTAMAELYAWALIAGAALLVRLGLRRPAVMLALLTALYQADPTLHTETCAFLGVTGVIAGGAWLGSFAGKLFALAWAMRVRLTPSAVLVPALGACGVVILPRLLSRAEPATLAPLVMLWLFALFAAALWTSREVESYVRLDAWGRQVLRRTTIAIWSLWGLLTLAHVCFWADAFRLPLTAIVPGLALLSTRWIRSELGVWATTAGALLLASRLPGLLPSVAAMATVTLLLRALRQPVPAEPPRPESGSAAPYRTAADRDAPAPAGIAFRVAAPAARARLAAGALWTSHLAAWTWSWSHGALPEHVLGLDLALTLALLILSWTVRSWLVAAVPLFATYAHFLLQAGFVSTPRTGLEWGLTCVGLGFALLVGALTVSYRLRGAEPLSCASESAAPTASRRCRSP